MTKVKFGTRAEFAFDHTTPGLTAGINTGIVVPDGAFVTLVVSITTPFDGTNAEIAVGYSQANALAANAEDVIVQAQAADVADPAGSDLYRNTGSTIANRFARGGDVELWIALLNSTDGGPPAGNSAGAGKLIVFVAA